jgi:RNA polymerase sigma-70 factor, ECF subfamily
MTDQGSRARWRGRSGATPRRSGCSTATSSPACCATCTEDIASETWLQVTRDLSGFTGSYDGFRGWVATIARHRVLDHRRRTNRKPALPVPAEDLASWPATGQTADTAARAIDAVATENAIALIATLPPDQAEAVLLRAVLGLDATTAGNVLGKRPGAIRTAASRGLRTLHRKLDQATTEPPITGPVTQTRDLALKDVR